MSKQCKRCKFWCVVDDVSEGLFGRVGECAFDETAITPGEHLCHNKGFALGKEHADMLQEIIRFKVILDETPTVEEQLLQTMRPEDEMIINSMATGLAMVDRVLKHRDYTLAIEALAVGGKAVVKARNLDVKQDIATTYLRYLQELLDN